MPTPRTVHLAGGDVTAHRHVCALVSGPEEFDALLLPFVAEGLTSGERAILVVDANAREAHLGLLALSGIDVPAVLASGQLGIRTWAESYLHGGRFDGSYQFAFLRRILDEGRELGFPSTRYLGTLEWAVDAPADVMSDLLHYEARVEGYSLRVPDTIICSYDLGRHSARTIADVLGIHTASVVGGVLRTSASSAPASARERLLAAASQLFNERGIQATGVDAVIDAAGVAKATFYRHFPSKDDLVIAWLRHPDTRWLDRLRVQAEANGAEGLNAIEQFFGALVEWLEDVNYRGCPYLNTAAEIPDPNHPGRLVIRDFVQEVQEYLGGLIAAAGIRDPGRWAAELHLLVAGSISLAVVYRSSVYALRAGEAALTLLAAAERD